MTTAIPALHVRLFGNISISTPAKRYGLRLNGSGKEIFGYLLYHLNREIRRDALLGLAWNDREDERARSCLNSVLWRIRKFLAKKGLSQLQLQSTSDRVCLRGQNVLVDTECLNDAVRAALEGQRAPLKRLPEKLSTELREASEDYAGPFLDGLENDWILSERERLLNIYLRGLSVLMLDHAAYFRYEDALEYGRRILGLDPLRETVQRQVMWLYVLNGQRASAIRQYADCADILQAELGIAPMEETTALYRYILGEVPLPSGRPRPVKGAAAIEAVFPANAAPAGLQSFFTTIHEQRRFVFASLIDPDN